MKNVLKTPDIWSAKYIKFKFVVKVIFSIVSIDLTPSKYLSN